MVTDQNRPQAAEDRQTGGAPPEGAQSTASGDVPQDIQQQIADAVQPVVDDLQRHISEVVQEQLQQGGGMAAEEDSAGTTDEGPLASIGQATQSAMEPLVDTVKRLWAWILEMAQKLGDKLAELAGELASILVQRAIRSAF